MSILRAESIRDRAGTGAPNFPNGATVTGVITATSFSGAVTGNVTGNVTGTSAGLTGTPSIIVQDATVQGDLTVNGTTSTIDTVITAVDSLAVDGQITGLGVAGVGTASPTNAFGIDKSLHVHSSLSSGTRGSGVHLTTNASGNTASDGVSIRLVDTDLSIDNRETGLINFLTAGTERLRITSGGTAIFKAGLAEKVNIKSQLTGANACAITDGNVILTTTNEPGNTYPNITGVHSTLAVGEGFSVTIALKVNGSGTINSFQIDGVGPTINWSGGSAPSAGASGYDVFTFSAIKTGTGTGDYAVFGAATNYA